MVNVFWSVCSISDRGSKVLAKGEIEGESHQQVIEAAQKRATARAVQLSAEAQLAHCALVVSCIVSFRDGCPGLLNIIPETEVQEWPSGRWNVRKG